MHAAKTARIAVGQPRSRRAARARPLRRDRSRCRRSRAFTETRPSQPVLLAAGGRLRAAVAPARPEAVLERPRESSSSEAARAPLAEFQNNLGILMGGLAVEDVFAGLGSAFDSTSREATPRASKRPPVSRRRRSSRSCADPALRTEFLLSFQTTIGIVERAAGAGEASRGSSRSRRCHREVLIACAAHPSRVAARRGGRPPAARAEPRDREGPA